MTQLSTMAGLNYAHLRYFWTVARESNLTRAARKLHVSQSAVSVQLKKLEDELGQRLFDRKGRGLELNRAGRVALDYAESIFELGEELVEVLEHEARAARQSLKVGVLATLSRNFQIGFLGPLFDREEVVVTVRSGAVDDLIPRLIAHELDVILSNSVPARAEGDTWVAHTIAQQAIGLIGRPPVRKGRSVKELLTEEPLVVPTVESAIRTAFDALCERVGVSPRIHAEIDDMAMLRLVTIRHRGLAVIPPIVVRDEIRSGVLIEHQQLPGIVEPFMAITVPRHMKNPLVAELLGEGGFDPTPELPVA
ncbi:MAG: LysR family transcriptional regulator [Myxococcota bacterium]